MDLNYKKNKFIDYIINKEDTEEIIKLWNKICSFNNYPAHINYMDNIDMFNFWQFSAKINKNHFNDKDKYYALDYQNQLISFNDINLYHKFNMVTLRNYLIKTNWEKLKECNDDLLYLFIQEKPTGEKGQLFIETLMDNNIIQMYNVDWNNLSKSIDKFFTKCLEIKK